MTSIPKSVPTPVLTGASVAAATTATPAKFDATALRDAAFNAHTPVPNGEGYKQQVNLTAASLAGVRQELDDWGHFDASRMVAVPKDNVTLRVVSFEYHSGKAMEGWIDAVPDDKILELNVVTCVSAHGGCPHDKFAKENVYVAEIRGPDGKTTQSPPFGPGVTKQDEHASVSPTMTIDISKPGDYSITCAPRGSAGTGGYIEGRKLILHVTGNEPTFPA